MKRMTYGEVLASNDIARDVFYRADEVDREMAALRAEAGKYHEVMECLRRLKMEHGTCFPRYRNACTHCAAAEKLLALQVAYKGNRVVLA